MPRRKGGRGGGEEGEEGGSVSYCLQGPGEDPDRDTVQRRARLTDVVQ